MTVKEKKVRLDRIIEFCLFCNATMNLQLKEDEKVRFGLKILSLKGDKIHAELESLNADDYSRIMNSQGLFIKAYYQRKFLRFDTELIAEDNVSYETGTDGKLSITLRKPDFGTVSNSREYHRISLNDIVDGCVELSMETQVGKVNFSTKLLADISESTIAIYLPRQGELILPGDKVSSAQLKIKDKTVFNINGSVIRVDLKKSHPSKPNSYLVVIGIKEQSHNHTHYVEMGKDRRRSQRVCLVGQTGAFVQFQHPVFTDRKLTGVLSDISTGGLSFLLESPKVPIMAGMLISNIEIQLPLQSRFNADLRILFCQTNRDADVSKIRVSGELLNVQSELFKAITRTIQHGIHPSLIDASQDDYDELWEFFFQSGFIYSDKRKQLQDYASGLFKTYSILLQAETPIIKKILYKEEGEIKGHISALKFFDNCWIIQHLNALKSDGLSSTAEIVLKGIINFFMGIKDAKVMGGDFASCYYRPNNLYPSIVFGETKNLINNPSICNLEELDFCLPKSLNDSESAKPVSSDIAIREATDLDLEELETTLVEQGKFHLLRVEGMTRDKIRNVKVSLEFQRLGLYRYRRVWVATWANSSNKIFAIANFASPGLNLSELTNSFRLIETNPLFQNNLEMSNQLCNKVLLAYRETEMPNAALLLDKNQTTPVQFERLRSYINWYIDSHYSRLFKEASQNVFANLKELIRKRKQNGQVRVAA